MLNLKTTLFCGISQRANWKQWLKANAVDLYNKLIEVQRQSSCRQNTVTMKDIRTELYNRNMGPQFEKFIKDNYPMIIDISSPIVPTQTPVKKPISSAVVEDKHGVFKNYRVGILTFPHKKIIVSENKEQLQASVDDFIADKVGVDYLIIDNYAYIEYFNKIYTLQADKIKKESRDIYQYRLRNAK